MTYKPLTAKIEQIASAARLKQVAVSFYDEESSNKYSHHGDRWFHAASTFKAAILLVLLKFAETGEVSLDDHLQVRNRFLGLTTGKPYRISRDRDGDSGVHNSIGKSLRLDQLARAMIVRSSNLATNLLMEFLTLEKIRSTLRQLGIDGLEVRRGVEDLAAHEEGINNEATADGMRQLFRKFIAHDALKNGQREAGLEILHAQEFNKMIPSKLPKRVRVAHKTGEISTHCHDAGIIFPPDREPYVLAVLTEFSEEAESPARAVAEISAAVYEEITGVKRG